MNFKEALQTGGEDQFESLWRHFYFSESGCGLLILLTDLELNGKDEFEDSVKMGTIVSRALEDSSDL